MLFQSRRSSWAFHWGAWLSMAGFFLAVLSYNFPLWEALVLSFGNFILLATIFYSHTYLTNRYWVQRQYGRFFAFGGLVFTAVSTLRFYFHALILKKYLVREGILLVSPEGRLGIFILVTSFIFAVTGVIIQLLINQYRRERDNLALLAEKQAAELQLLKSQINPHFLFNALNNLYSLVVTQSELAAPLLVKLSALLRYVIYESQKPSAELGREIREMENFIELFSLQHDPAPQIRLKTEGNPAGLYMEPMLLIPLVENCFKHADFGQNPGAYCIIRAEITAQHHLVFTTENTYNPANRQKDRTGGVGLDNIRRRLSLLFPDVGTFQYEGKDRVFTVKLEIPLRNSTQQRRED